MSLRADGQKVTRVLHAGLAHPRLTADDRGELLSPDSLLPAFDQRFRTGGEPDPANRPRALRGSPAWPIRSSGPGSFGLGLGTRVQLEPFQCRIRL